jgi:dihydroorotate dehydrogenase
MIYEKVIRPLLFNKDPEWTHDNAKTILKGLSALRPVCKALELCNFPASLNAIELFGIQFPNAIGLAAGMDKDADFVPAATALGFGHIEIGTVTPFGQSGNPKPRLFRFPEEEAIVNRMGFNSLGAEVVLKNLRSLPDKKKRRSPVGVNIGKAKNTPIEEAPQDYLSTFEKLADFADYFTLNVSSPNTPGLRKLQGKDSLNELLLTITKANNKRDKKVPILLKIAPDLNFHELDDVIDLLFSNQMDGIIATNTTINRQGNRAIFKESGGLSGAPLDSMATDIISYISKSTDGKLPIIGVGGITDIESAGRKMDAGASILQVYTGLIYRGPSFPKKLAIGLSARQKDWI